MSEELLFTVMKYWFPLMGISLVGVGGWCFASEFQFDHPNALGMLMGITLAVLGVWLVLLGAGYAPAF